MLPKPAKIPLANRLKSELFSCDCSVAGFYMIKTEKFVFLWFLQDEAIRILRFLLITFAMFEISDFYQ